MPDHHLPDPPALAGAAAAPMRRRWLLPALAVLVLLLGGAGAAAWIIRRQPAASPAPAAAPTPALTVALAEVREERLARPVVGDGSVAAWQELVIGTETGGLKVVEVNFEEGDQVRQGQVLVRIDPAVPAAQAAQAEAAAIEAEAALRLAEADLRRSAELARTESVARQTLDQRQSAARQAEARLIAARARRDEAQARLEQVTIEAPADGVISRRTILLGAVVQPGQEMFRLIRDGRLELDARVPELDLGGVAPGQRVRVIHGAREIEARVRTIAPVVAGETRLGIVRVALPPDSGLRPGMFARAEILPEAATPVLTVPQEAVVFRGGGAVAFVLPEGAERVVQRAVVPGQRREGRVEVTAGLAAGERVVATGAGFLSDGDMVRVAPPAAPAAR